MNTISQIQTKYLRPSRTIEAIEISAGSKKKVCFIYNYEGNHFRFFQSQDALYRFIEFGVEPQYSFQEESELDHFLENFSLN